ncbi:MAG: efflux RND transporter permease subunit, partial [Planctomycetes bacterium]|nr:efflux RND transporter permease subunit [Planctomycetota bacterium]
VVDGVVEAAAEVPEAMLAALDAGAPATVEAGGRRRPGRVRRLDPALDPVTRLGAARIALDDHAGLGPGGSAQVHLAGARRDGLVVPAAAVQHGEGGMRVLVVADGRCRAGARRPGGRRAGGGAGGGAGGRRRGGGRGGAMIPQPAEGAEGISAWAIRHPLPPLVLCLLLTVLGALAWARLPVQSMPAVTIPLVSVTVAQNGAAPADLERQVTRRIEAAVAGVAGIKHVQSTVAAGLSTTIAEFHLAVAPDRAADDVREAVLRIRGALPAGVRDPVVERIDIDGAPILTLAVAGHGRDDAALSWFVDDTVLRELQAVPGVASVRREGGSTRELRVELDPARLAARGLGPDQVDAALRGAISDLPGGRIATAGRERLVRVEGAADLAGLRLHLGGGRTLALGEVAQVVDGPAEPERLARLDGRPVVACAIFRAKGASEVAVADAVRARLDRLRQEHPWASFSVETDWVQPTRDSYAGAVAALVEGSLLAMAVVWLFLRDWRATAIAALAIPLSVLPTFAAMQLLGYSLNTITLLAVSLVSGILVDDAIVEIENIARFRAAGERPFRAALLAADRIGLAVVATTLAIAVVFVPEGLMPGIAGRYFVEFAFTVVVAVLASLLVARLITPLLAAWLLRGEQREAEPGRLAGAYARLLRWCLARRRTCLGAAALLLAASAAALAGLPAGFIAPGDRGQILVGVTVPPDATLAQAEAAVERAAAVLRAAPEARSTFVRIEVPRSVVTLTLAPRAERGRSAQQVAAALRPA